LAAAALYKSINQSINRSINQSIDQSINQNSTKELLIAGSKQPNTNYVKPFEQSPNA